MAILDTDFLSSFFKIGKLDLILRALNLEYVTVPSTVYEELKKAKFFDDIVSLFAFKEEELSHKKFILIKNVNLGVLADFTEEERITLGKGELGCFVLGKNKELILIDDSKARTVAEKKNLKVVSVSSFLLYCKKNNIISVDELKQIIDDLKVKDYYEFTDEIKKILLE